MRNKIIQNNTFWNEIAPLYDKLWEHRGDSNFYIECAKRFGGPVLEYGIGTGRLLLPIARAGIKCYGIDFSEEILN